MDLFLLIVAIIVVIILLAINVYLIVYFQHPDDKNESYLPKFLILIGFTIAQCSILLLPLDVANKEGYSGCDGYDTAVCGGIDMALLWEITYLAVLVYVVLLIPFAIFYYEADDGQGNLKESMFCQAFKYEICVLIISTLTLVLMYFFLGTTNIPVTTYSASFSSSVSSSVPAGSWTDTTQPPPFAAWSAADVTNAASTLPGADGFVSLKVTFPVYVMAMEGFVGWFFFVIFAGVGLSALPVDLVCAFIYRPRHMDAVEFAEAQLSVRQRVNDLIEIGELLKLCHENYHKYNPLVPIFKLFLGIISLILSLLWVVQICIFILPSPPLTPFLNDYFQWFDTWFPLFGVLSVGIFAVYLQFCVIKGCFKFGVRFFFITLHPMKMNGTYMNSFLFNLGLILLCSLPVVQFSVLAFGDYARFTNVNQIFGVQIKYLQ
ncbi:hypothetical protein TrRE_jg3308, partial [Triparma retinervis]